MSRFYETTGKDVNNTDTSDQSDVNDVNAAVDAGFDLVESEIDVISAQSALPSGGTTGQALLKDSAVDRDVSWQDIHAATAGDDIDVDTGALTGAYVISDLDFNITTNAEGHVTDANGAVATRQLTATNLGLGNVDNTADADKPVSTATTSAIAAAVHDESHTITSHSDVTNATGAELETLTDGSNADALHSHTAASLPFDAVDSIGNAGTSLDLDSSAYRTHIFTCDQSTLTLTVTDFAVGVTINLIITNGGGCTITWPAGTDWPGGSQPVLSTTGVDRVVMQMVTTAPLIHAAGAGINYA